MNFRHFTTTAAQTTRKALAIFAKEPLPGRVKTRLIPPLTPVEAAGLYRAMLGDVLTRASSIPGVEPWLFLDPGGDGTRLPAAAIPLPRRLQEGSDLGVRMENCFRELFAAGCTEVAIIGSDSPDLPAAHIAAAFTRLQTTDVVYGPSEDGGYYLIALKAVHDVLFRDIPWSSGKELELSRARAASAGLTVDFLPSWYDVDTPADLERPGLVAAGNGAPLTREFLLDRAGRGSGPPEEHENTGSCGAPLLRR